MSTFICIFLWSDVRLANLQQKQWSTSIARDAAWLLQQGCFESAHKLRALLLSDWQFDPVGCVARRPVLRPHSPFFGHARRASAQRATPPYRVDRIYGHHQLGRLRAYRRVVKQGLLALLPVCQLHQHHLALFVRGAHPVDMSEPFQCRCSERASVIGYIC